MATAVLDLVTNNSASTDIATVVAQTPAIVLVDRDQRKSLYDHIEREIAAFEPDTSTKKGRDAIKALAFKITKTKTAIDAAGKTLNEEARAKINVVDEARRDARNTLDILAEKVRQPLTEWETAEEARQVRVEGAICEIRDMAKVSIDDTAASVRERGMQVFGTSFDSAEFGDRLDEAESAKAAAIDTLKTALVRLTKEEADRAELEKLRAEAAERERLAAEKAATERAVQEAAERAQAEQERAIAAAKAEAERIERVRKDAAEQAQRDAEKAAQAERDRVQREHNAEIAAERAKSAEADRLRQAEADRIAEVERQRAAQEAAARAEQQRLDAEQAKRVANQAHRTRVKTAAKQAIMTCGASEDAAQKIVLAIIAGEIPSVRLEF